MTDFPTSTTMGATVAGAVIVGLIDPAIQSIALAVIAALVVIIPVWFKFKTDALHAKMKDQDLKIEDVIKTSNGMKDALVRATGESKLAEGVLQGKAEEVAKQAVVAKATAVGVAQEKAEEQLRKETPL